MKNFPIVKSRRLRSTPYTDRIESHGVSSYTVYNHMLLCVLNFDGATGYMIGKKDKGLSAMFTMI